MKKMLLLLAGMACLGMFVSCSDDPQEVVVTNSQERVEWVGTVTGSMTSSYYNSVKVNEDALATLTCYENEKGNAKSYELEVPYLYRNSSSGDYYDDEAYLSIKKVGNDYYNTRDGKKLEVSGSLDGKEFTIASIERSSNKFTNLTFTRM